MNNHKIGSHDTRILIDIPGKLPSNGNGDLKKYMINNIIPLLPKSVHSSFLNAIEEQRMRSMPNSFLPPTKNASDGFIVIGDAWNMRHPMTGGGMTVGLWDVVHLRELLSPSTTPTFDDKDSIVNQASQLWWARKSRSSVINILAQALYSLFSADQGILCFYV